MPRTFYKYNEHKVRKNRVDVGKKTHDDEEDDDDYDDEEEFNLFLLVY